MRHQVDGRKFGRNSSHRVAMFRNMANQTILEERIVTTVQKAKEVRRVVDRLITLAKKKAEGEFNPNRRVAFDRTRDKEVVSKLFGELSKRYADRKGGYTRVVKLVDRRWGDAAEMAVLELVDHAPLVKGKAAKAPKKSDAEGTQTAAPATAADPFARFRKLFSPKKAASSKTEAPATKKAAPKAPRAKKAKAAE
jgi:large subunit ribosomal protein L17